MTRLQELYTEKVIPELQEKFRFQSVMAIPKVTKITLNMGLGEALTDRKVIEHAVKDLTLIAGQKPVVTKARKSIAAFKVREDLAHRLQSDFASESHVRVSRSTHQRCDTADPGFSRIQPAGL